MKDLKDYTFDELVTWLSWQVIQDIVRGRNLQAIVFFVCERTCAWRATQPQK